MIIPPHISFKFEPDVEQIGGPSILTLEHYLEAYLDRVARRRSFDVETASLDNVRVLRLHQRP